MLIGLHLSLRLRPRDLPVRHQGGEWLPRQGDLLVVSGDSSRQLLPLIGQHGSRFYHSHRVSHGLVPRPHRARTGHGRGPVSCGQ